MEDLGISAGKKVLTSFEWDDYALRIYKECRNYSGKLYYG